MADKYFDVEIDLPGEIGVLDNDLIEATADHHEIDLVNDETFGDCEQEWNYEEHDQKAELLEQNNGGRIEEDVPVEFMEKSISQLVVDDDDPMDPAIVDARTKPRAIPKRGIQNIDELFGPSSPPSLLDADELVSPDHHNIWRPNKSSPAPAHPLIANRPVQQPFDDPSIVTAGKAIPVGFHSSASHKAPPPLGAAPGAGRPRPYTLEEVERQITNRSPTIQNQHGRSSPRTMNSFPPHFTPGIPPPGGAPYDRVSPNSEISHKPTQPPVGTPSRATRPQMTPGAPGIVRLPPSHMTPGGPGNAGLPRPHMTPGGPGSMGTPRHHMTPGAPGTPMGQTRMPYNSITPGVYGIPRGPPVRMGPRHQGQGDGPWMNSQGPNTPRGQRPPYRPPHTDPGLMRTHRDGPGMDNDRGQHQYRQNRDQQFPDHHHYTRMTTQQPRISRDTPSRGARDPDEYATEDSLMTQREKDWVIKIQMLQLHTDNPYIDDYYYMQFKMKQLAAERRKQKVGVSQSDDGPKLLLPQLAHLEVRNYTPAQFEGVLGRLTASSVHNPRQVIDCKINVTHSDEGNLKGTKYKQVLVFIEKLYDILLDVDDLEKRMLASAEDAHPRLATERRQKLDTFYHSLDCENNTSLKFNSIMCIRKGKQLIVRVLPLLTEDQGYKLVDYMLRQLPILIRKDMADEVLPGLYGSVSAVIERCDLDQLVSLAQSLQTAAVPTSQTNSLLTTIQNKFGLSVVCCMLQRCEQLHSDNPLDLDNSHKDKWSQFVSDLADKLTLASERSLPLHKPLAKFDNLTRHFERSVDKKTILCVEEVVKSWS